MKNKSTSPSSKIKTSNLRGQNAHSTKKERIYLTPEEVHELSDLAKTSSRYGERDSTMILLTYRHGLRVSELCSLEWSDVNLDTGLLHISSRLNKGKDRLASVHPLHQTEIASLRKLKQESQGSPYVFMNERGNPITPAGFRQLLHRLGSKLNVPFSVSPHMLRHSCGYKLANDGHDTRSIQQYLGHKYIQNTARYTVRLPTSSFHDFWKD